MVRDEVDVNISNNDDGIGDVEGEDGRLGEVVVVTDAQIRRSLNLEAVDFVLGVRSLQVVSAYLQLWYHFGQVWRPFRFQ